VSKNNYVLPKAPIDLLEKLYPKETESTEPTTTQSKDVIFDGNYECGNIETCVLYDGVYEVYLRNDSNGIDSMWFNFKIRNSQNFCGNIKIKIVNIHKERNML
jgi:Cytosolic carboxypeptidase N-terminal domain